MLFGPPSQISPVASRETLWNNSYCFGGVYNHLRPFSTEKNLPCGAFAISGELIVQKVLLALTKFGKILHWYSPLGTVACSGHSQPLQPAWSWDGCHLSKKRSMWSGDCYSIKFRGISLISWRVLWDSMTSSAGIFFDFDVIEMACTVFQPPLRRVCSDLQVSAHSRCCCLNRQTCTMTDPVQGAIVRCAWY